VQPQGKGKLPLGSTATVLVVDPLPAPPSAQSFFRGAAGLDEFHTAALKGEALRTPPMDTAAGEEGKQSGSEGPKKVSSFITPQEICVGLLTISDRVST
jgi:hypothetical protein